MPPPRPVFVAANEDSRPAWMSIKADAATTGSVLGLAEVTIPLGHSPGLHVHRDDEDEAFYVLQGTIDFICSDDRFRGEAAAFVFLPRGLPHAFLGVSDPAAGVLVLMLSAGLEQMFSETDPARIDAILAAHGVKTVGPPLSA